MFILNKKRETILRFKQKKKYFLNVLVVTLIIFCGGVGEGGTFLRVSPGSGYGLEGEGG